jgi:release factor glutamine methyltransferase
LGATLSAVRPILPSLVMANLPYIARDEVPMLEVSRYEPVLALNGGADGLVLIRRLLAQVKAHCRAGTWVLLEIGADQGAAVVAAGQALGYGSLELRRDYANLDRIIGMHILR